MILQALVAYYDRLAKEGAIPPLGWADREIGWVVFLSPDGHAKAFQNTYQPVTVQRGKKSVSELRAKSFRVPAGEHKQGINPRLLWDNPEYALGLPKGDTKKKIEDAKAKCEAFARRIQSLGLEALAPIVTFLGNGAKLEELKACDPGQFATFMEEVAKPKGSTLITFRLFGDDDVVCARPDVREACDRQWAESVAGDTLCIASGIRGAVTETTDPVHLRGGQTSGCRLVAFQKNSGFDSYHKEQGRNAPIAERTTFRYTAALQALIDSPAHRLYVGEETLLFWASSPNPVEDALTDLLGYHAAEDDDSGAIALKGILTAAQQGQMPGFRDDGRFWLLLLQPVSARIAVRLWVEQTPTETAIHLRDWFADLDIDKSQKEQGKPIPIYRLLASLSPQGDVKNLPPRLGGDLLYAALRGTPIPDGVAQATLRRLKNENVTSIRAALLKAWLIRNPLTQTERKPTVMLDLENDNPGYCLGRLFAVLEKAQEDALPGLNATIKDKFYATASADPAAVLATLIRNGNHHIEKIAATRPQAKTFYERLKQEILGHLSDIPAHLDLADQARFALGYYHQRQALFAKKDKPEAPAEAPAAIQDDLPHNA